MTPLKDKIQDSLDETRMLVLGSEIPVGFEFTAHFQDGFSDLPEISGIANTAGLGLMLIVDQLSAGTLCLSPVRSPRRG
jgi:hypothetical protein